MGDFERTVQEMTIPNQLKEYLISSKTVRNIATKEILNDIEDLFILYSSHYFFDTTDFSLNTIQTLKRVPCPNPIYRYLQTVIENNMFLISKGDEDNYTLLENTLIEEVLDSSISKRQITPTYSSGGRCYMLDLVLFWNSAMIWQCSRPGQ